ncbi:MAG: FAD-dependent oxidoreductase [Leptolyngbyaceae cyanobacterium bins.349]|nr:FAD-dependent oxidoreductase [Leptolyngbyaceae cyanobacterium bins.349]
MIVGCGVVGAAIAYELSQLPGLDITILEQQSAPALGASGAALGVLMGAISTKPKGRNLRMRLFGIQQYNAWIPRLEAITGRSIPFNQQGILRLCLEGEDLERWHSLATIRREQGWELQVCDRAFLATHYPQLNLERVLGAVYSPGDRQLDPTALTLALVAAAAHQGVNVQLNTSVESLQATRDLVQLKTSQGLIEADWLVIAAGVGSTPLTAHLQRPVEIRPVLGQALRLKVSQPLGRADLQPVITGDDVHLVPLAYQEYWVGATVEFADVPEALDAHRIQPNANQLAAVLQQAIAMCPALQTATILHQWYGLRPRPEGRPAPIIESLPGHANILLATGHYRNGVLLAPATAHQVKAAIAAEDTNL